MKNSEILFIVLFIILSISIMYNLFWSETARLKKVVHVFDVVKTMQSDEILDEDIADILKPDNDYFIVTLTNEELSKLGSKQGNINLYDESHNLIGSMEAFKWKDRLVFKLYGIYFELR